MSKIKSSSVFDTPVTEKLSDCDILVHLLKQYENNLTGKFWIYFRKRPHFESGKHRENNEIETIQTGI